MKTLLPENRREERGLGKIIPEEEGEGEGRGRSREEQASTEGCWEVSSTGLP